MKRIFISIWCLLLMTGVFLPSTALAKDAIGDICTCVYDDYGSDSTDYVLLRSNVTYELGEEYPTPTDASCNSACESAISAEDLLRSYTFVAAPVADMQSAPPETKFSPLIPELSVKIPGISFSEIKEEGGKIYISTLSEYIAGFYRVALGLAAVFAIVMIMIGGVQYMLGSATGGEAVGAAKTRITNAVTGLVLVLAAYTILYVVNPNLTTFEALVIEAIPESQFNIPSDGEDDNVNPDAKKAPEGTSQPVHENSDGIQTIGVASGVFANDIMLDDLYLAADALYADLAKTMKITSGYRTPDNQLRILWEKCFAGTRGGVCDVIVCNPLPTSIMTKSTSGGSRKFTLQGSMASISDEEAFVGATEPFANPAACPHTSSVAIDAWCSDSADYIFDTKCQDKLTQYMQQHGFCRLQAEPWHFEYAAYSVSKSCSTDASVLGQFKVGDTSYKYSDCTRYDAKNKKCVSN